MKHFFSITLMLGAVLTAASVFAAPDPADVSLTTTPECRIGMKRANGKQPYLGRWKKMQKNAARPDAKEKYKVLFVGDSITQLFETGKGKEIWQSTFAANSFNLGIGGDRTQHTLWMLSEAKVVDKLDPKLVILLIGTNNLGKKRHTPEATAAGVRKILDELRTRFPKAVIVNFAIFPRGEKGQYGEAIDKTNAMIKKFADGEHIIYDDSCNAKFVDANGEVPEQLLYDRLHPSAEGYEIWKAAILPYVEKYAK